MPRRIYRHPPIEEALCEIRFSEDSPWDLTIPGRVHGAVRGDYPAVEQQLLETGLLLPGGQQAPVRRGLGPIRLKTTDGKALLSLAPNLLSVHVLREYPGWEVFRQRVEGALDAYLRVAQPRAVSRIGVRYVNRIVARSANADPAVYFRLAHLAVPGTLPGTTTFLHRDELAYPDGAKLLLTTATVESPSPESTAFLLDLDMVAEGLALPVPEVLARVDELRTRERDAFESLVTDSAREEFDAEPV